MASVENHSQHFSAHVIMLASAAGGLHQDGLTLVLVGFPLAAVAFLAVRIFRQPDRTSQPYSYGRYMDARTFRWVFLALGIVGLVLLVAGR